MLMLMLMPMPVCPDKCQTIAFAAFVLLILTWCLSSTILPISQHHWYTSVDHPVEHMLENVVWWL